MGLLEIRQKLVKDCGFPVHLEHNERFLSLALCGEAGELANMIKKRWRDGVDLSEEVMDEIADIRVYLELIAKLFGISGDKLDERVTSKLKRVAARRKAILNTKNHVASYRKAMRKRGLE